MKKLTSSQHRVFEFICNFQHTEGFPPSYADIAAQFNFSSDGTVRTYLQHLENKGYIKRLGKARGIQILKNPIKKSIPILGQIAAGTPTLATENQIGMISDVTELQFKDGRFALVVKGNSMINAGIHPGDIAIIQSGIPVHQGAIVAILIDEEATLKRYYKEKDHIRLQPENDAYKPLYLNKPSYHTQILGKCIATFRRH